MTRDQALSLWSRSTDSKALDYQRINPRDYQIVRTHTKETTWIWPGITQPPVAPVQEASSKQQTKQRHKPSHHQTGLPLHSALPMRGKTSKQTNKNSAQISPYMKLTQTTGPTLEGRNQKEERIQPWSLGKGDLKHNQLRKQIMKRQRNTTQMKEQTRNTEVQINGEEIGKLLEKEFRIM